MLYFKPKKIPIRVGNKYIAILNEKMAKELDVRPADRMHLTIGKKRINVILDVTSKKELNDDQVGLFAEAWEKLDVKKGTKIKITVAPKPPADVFIKEKLHGKTLSKAKIFTIIRDVVNDDLSDIELTYFVSACFMKELNDEETTNLTKAIVKYGDRLEFKDRFIMDKHCIGGVPGNRTTMLVVPIVTALGYRMPKTSSRAITSPSGTADTMEVLAHVTNDGKKLTKIANKIGGFISWGGGVDIASADDKLIRVRYPLKLDPQGMLLASIMAKKYAVSANHLIIDIPSGYQGKVKTKKETAVLKKRFLSIGKKLGMKMKVVITSADQPIGNGIGPVLETLDVLKVLNNEEDAPQDLRNKSIMLATELINLTGKYKTKKEAEKVVIEVLDSGKAYKQLQRIIDAQGRKKQKPLGSFTHDFNAPKSGKICKINNKLIASIARTAGAPKDLGAGLYLYKKLGDKVKKGEKLFTVYAHNKTRINYVKDAPLKGVYRINNH